MAWHRFATTDKFCADCGMGMYDFFIGGKWSACQMKFDRGGKR